MKKLGTLFLSATTAGALATQAMTEETVTLMSWGKYFDPEVFKEFEAETGNVDLAIAKQLTQVDPGNDYTLPYTWGTTGIG